MKNKLPILLTKPLAANVMLYKVALIFVWSSHRREKCKAKDQYGHKLARRLQERYDLNIKITKDVKKFYGPI